jgi:rRNA maturation RNase YbeY
MNGDDLRNDDSDLVSALERCVVHGVLHLCGFDHERDDDSARAMFELEQKVLDDYRSNRVGGVA